MNAAEHILFYLLIDVEQRRLKKNILYTKILIVEMKDEVRRFNLNDI
jgi:hypothetical protein